MTYSLPILRIARFFETAGCVDGGTRLHKTCYILQRLGCPLGLDYAFGHFGPFSRDLIDQVNRLVDWGLVRIVECESNHQYIASCEEIKSYLKDIAIDWQPEFDIVIKRLLEEKVFTLQVAATWLLLTNMAHYGGMTENPDDFIREWFPYLVDSIEAAHTLLYDLGYHWQVKQSDETGRWVLCQIP